MMFDLHLTRDQLIIINEALEGDYDSSDRARRQKIDDVQQVIANALMLAWLKDRREHK